MKKRMAAAALALTLCPSLLLTSCDKVSESKVKKDPAGLSVQAISRNFEKNETVNTAEKVLSADKIHIRFETSSRYGYDMQYDAYFGGDSGAVVIGEGLPFGEASVYYNGKEIAVQADDILESPVGIKFADIDKDKILNSTLADELGLDEDDLDDAWDVIEQFRDSIKDVKASNKKMKNLEKKVSDSWKKILADTKPEIATEKLELHDGTIPVVTATYDIDGDVITDMVDTLITEIQASEILPEDMLDEYEYFLEDLGDRFDDIFESFELKTGIAKKSGMLVYAEVNADVGSYEYTITLDLGKDPEKSDEYLLTAEDDNDNSFEVKYERSGDKNEISRKAKFYSNGSKQGEIKLDWNKKDGDYTIEADIDGESVEFTGELKLEKNKIEFVLDEIIEVPEIKIVIETGAKIPAVPKYQNILEMTEDEINDAYEAYAEALYGGYSVKNAEADDSYYDWDDDDYDWDDYDYDWDDDEYGWDDDDYGWDETEDTESDEDEWY